VALEDCVLMNFVTLDQIDMFKQAHDENILEKSQLLQSIPAYALCSPEKLVSEEHLSAANDH
jgi:hypothetical protein